MRYVSNFFFGVEDRAAFFDGMSATFKALGNLDGLFAGDNLISIRKNLSFLDDEPFIKAYGAHAQTNIERGIIWRIWTVVWGARNGLKLDGDFVECACYKGTTARIVCDTIDFGSQSDRRYFLYDMFEHEASMDHLHMPEHSNTLFEETKARFADLPNVVVTQGEVPHSFAKALPEKIAFLHLDLNNADAEIGALEILFDRIVPGGVMILDDYGWLGYRAQKLAEDPWLAARGYHVLELPTGQGLVFK